MTTTIPPEHTKEFPVTHPVSWGMRNATPVSGDHPLRADGSPKISQQVPQCIKDSIRGVLDHKHNTLK